MVVVWITALLTAAPITAQTFHGGIRGAVRDATGILPGATITLVNEGTRLSRIGETNNAGEYAFPNVVPGTYSLLASLSGYRMFESRGLVIGTQQFLIVDIQLALGAVAEEVIVTGQTPLLDTANASVAAVIDRTALETLPSTGRNLFLFSTTVANVIPTGVPFFTRMQDQNSSSALAIAGGPRRANTYLLDGVPITDLLSRAAILPSLEAIDEVRVQVSTYDAELGRTGGGVFNATHRAGSNAWHGSALARNRPDWGAANLFFARRAGTAKPDSYDYLWAGSLGGPIVRNRTFFWTSTEGYRSSTIRNTVLTWPTERERHGDFSGSVDGAGRPIVIYDPLTTTVDPNRPGQLVRQPFPGNVIPQERINPVARALMRFYPLPDAGRQATRTAPVVDVANQATLKIDHRITAGYTLSGTYAWYESDEPSPTFYGGLPSDPNLGVLARGVHLVALNHLFTLASSTVLAVRYGFNQFSDDSAVPEFDSAQLALSPALVRDSSVKAFPSFQVEDYAGLGSGTSDDVTFRTHVVNATISRLAGRHTVKIGGDYRRLGLDLFRSPRLTLGFSKAFTQGPNPNVGAPNSGDAIASLLLGVPAQGSVIIGTPLAFSAPYYAAYVQDDVRLTPNLTLNVGLRYDYEGGLQEREHRFTVGFDRTRPFPIQVPGLDLRGGLMYAGADGYPTHQSSPSRAKFGPRAGVAWSLGARMV
ncbi:MAG: TonB-dependent receptor domain-containing protein [Acidobacteriota bacterium]